MPDDTEVQIKEAVTKVMKDIAASLDDLNSKTSSFNRVSADGLKRIGEQANKSRDQVHGLGESINSAASSAQRLYQVLGALGIAGAFAWMDRLAKSSLNLRYTSKEAGMSAQEYVKLRQAFERMDLSPDRITPAANSLRDFNIRGFQSDPGQKLLRLGAGATAAGVELLKLNETTHSTFEEFSLLSTVSARLTGDQRKYFLEAFQAPDRLYDLNKMLKLYLEEIILGDVAARKYSNAMEDVRVTLRNLGTTIGGALIVKLDELLRKLEDLGIFKDLKTWIEQINVDKLATDIGNAAGSVAELLKQIGLLTGAMAAGGDNAPAPPPIEDRPIEKPPLQSHGPVTITDASGDSTKEAGRGLYGRQTIGQYVDENKSRWIDSLKAMLGMGAAASPASAGNLLPQGILGAEIDANKILLDIRDALRDQSLGTGSALQAIGGSSQGSIDPGVPTKGRSEAFNTLQGAAANAGSPYPEQTAAIGSSESSFMSKGIFVSSGGTNVMGQSGIGPAGSVMGSEGKPFKVYNSLDEGLRDHLRRWGKYYRPTLKETLQNLVLHGYNQTDPNWAAKIAGIYQRYYQPSTVRITDADPVDTGSFDRELRRRSIASGLIDGTANITVDVQTANSSSSTPSKMIFLPIAPMNVQQMELPKGLNSQ